MKVGVRPGSWFHRTECFGPVLGVMRAADLDDALALQNAHRVRADRRPAQPRSRRDRALARAGRGRQRVREPPHHRRDRAAPAVRRMEALVGRARARRPVARRHPALRSLHRAHARPAALDPSVFDAARPRRAARRAEPAALPAAVDKVVVRATAIDDRPTNCASSREAARITGVPIEVVASARVDDVLAARIGASGRARLRALGPISDVLARACHARASSSTTPPSPPSARVELPRWMSRTGDLAHAAPPRPRSRVTRSDSVTPAGGTDAREHDRRLRAFGVLVGAHLLDDRLELGRARRLDVQQRVGVAGDGVGVDDRRRARRPSRGCRPGWCGSGSRARRTPRSRRRRPRRRARP